jgi:hypothetical protein
LHLYNLLHIYSVHAQLFFQQSTQDFNDFVSDFDGAHLTAKVFGSQAESTLILAIQDDPDRFFNGNSLFSQTEGISEKHGYTQDGPDRVCYAFPSDVGGRAVDGFVQAGTWLRRRREAC